MSSAAEKYFYCLNFFFRLMNEQMTGVTRSAAVMHQYGTATSSGGDEFDSAHSAGPASQYSEHANDINGSSNAKIFFARNATTTCASIATSSVYEKILNIPLMKPNRERLMPCLLSE